MLLRGERVKITAMSGNVWPWNHGLGMFDLNCKRTLWLIGTLCVLSPVQARAWIVPDAKLTSDFVGGKAWSATQSLVKHSGSAIPSTLQTVSLTPQHQIYIDFDANFDSDLTVQPSPSTLFCPDPLAYLSTLLVSSALAYQFSPAFLSDSTFLSTSTLKSAVNAAFTALVMRVLKVTEDVAQHVLIKLLPQLWLPVNCQVTDVVNKKVPLVASASTVNFGFAVKEYPNEQLGDQVEELNNEGESTSTLELPSAGDDKGQPSNSALDESKSQNRDEASGVEAKVAQTVQSAHEADAVAKDGAAVEDSDAAEDGDAAKEAEIAEDVAKVAQDVSQGLRLTPSERVSRAELDWMQELPGYRMANMLSNAMLDIDVNDLTYEAAHTKLYQDANDAEIEGAGPVVMVSSDSSFAPYIAVQASSDPTKIMAINAPDPVSVLPSVISIMSSDTDQPLAILDSDMSTLRVTRPPKVVKDSTEQMRLVVTETVSLPVKAYQSAQDILPEQMADYVPEMLAAPVEDEGEQILKAYTAEHLPTVGVGIVSVESSAEPAATLEPKVTLDDAAPSQITQPNDSLALTEQASTTDTTFAGSSQRAESQLLRAKATSSQLPSLVATDAAVDNHIALNSTPKAEHLASEADALDGAITKADTANKVSASDELVKSNVADVHHSQEGLSLDGKTLADGATGLVNEIRLLADSSLLEDSVKSSLQEKQLNITSHEPPNTRTNSRSSQLISQFKKHSEQESIEPIIRRIKGPYVTQPKLPKKILGHNDCWHNSADVLKFGRSKDRVCLTGHLTGFIQSDKYEFRDKAGTLILRLDQRVEESGFAHGHLLQIEGEIEQNWRSFHIRVTKVVILNE